jgi:hypothetical protein
MPSGEEAAADAAAVLRAIPGHVDATRICSSAAAAIRTDAPTYKNVVKMTFAKGASLADPSGLFNSSLEGNTRRAIDFREGDELDEEALKALIRAAVALNTSVAHGQSSRRLRMTLRSAIRHSTELYREGVGRQDGRPFGPTQSGNRTYDLDAAIESVSPAVAMIDRWPKAMHDDQ